MGKLESESRQRLKKNQLRELILNSLKLGGLLSLAVVAPNVIGAMAKLGIIESPRQREVIRNASKRLVATGHLQWRGSKLRLTEKGEHELRVLTLRQSQRLPRKWDHKWRVLIFDIPERRKGLRQRVREVLRSLGFVLLQDSVWVYPHDCEDLITLIKADFKIGYAMLYMIVDTIENDRILKQHFKLS